MYYLGKEYLGFRYINAKIIIDGSPQQAIDRDNDKL